jgi:polygalacturonase
MDSVHAAGCKALITADHVNNAGIMGDGVIDGRGGDRMLGQDKSWWDLAEMTRPGYGHQVTHIVTANFANNFTMYRITLKNSGNVHVSYRNGDGFTAWGVIIDTPKRHSRNSDGIDPGGKNITITHCYIRDGDDNVAINGGGTGVTNVTISHDHFYWGHGLSIGSPTSGGVSKIRAFDVSVDGADNGIRIKSNGSRGGLTHDVSYDNMCIRNSADPVMLDTAYGGGGDLRGPLPPVMRDVTLHNVRISGGGKFSFNGYDQEHRVQANLNNVLITDDAKYIYSMNHADINLGPGPVNLKLPAGTDSTIQGTPASTGKPLSCDAMFVPFPLHYSAVR